MEAILTCLDAKGVSFGWQGARGTPAVLDVSCSLEAGVVTGLAGLAGSGKSTLGMLFKGLLKPDAGSFKECSPLVPGGELKGGESANLPPLRSRGGLRGGSYASKPPRVPGDSQVLSPPVPGYFQHFSPPVPGGELKGGKILSESDLMRLVGWCGAQPERQIFASTVREEVAFGPSNQGLEGEALERRIADVLTAVGLNPDDYLKRHPLELSGGERRRVALAGVAAMQFLWYVFDEPTAGLDLPGIRHYLKLVKQLTLSGSGVLWISHDLSLLAPSVDYLWVMQEGGIALQQESSKVDWRGLMQALENGNAITQNPKPKTHNPKPNDHSGIKQRLQLGQVSPL